MSGRIDTPHERSHAAGPVRSRHRFGTAFHSILYEHDEHGAGNAPRKAPDYFGDLNLDQIVDAITAGKNEYDLKPLFHDSLKTTDAVLYRHEVMRDLENGAMFDCIKAFANSMRLMRQKLEQANKLYHKYQKHRWFLHAVETYCTAVRELRDGLSRLQVSSRGMAMFRDHVADYAGSERFLSLVSAVDRLVAGLAAIHYSILIKGNGFKVLSYGAEQDYSAEVAEVFAKFRQGAAKDYRVDFPARVEMNHIEAKVLDFVALLDKEAFSCLDDFVAGNRQYADPLLMRFDREIQFYVAYIDYMNTLRRAGLQFCYPRVFATDKEVRDQDGFDLALATKLVAEHMQVVCNDFRLTGPERILVVSGPNQGGKTTFARTFGQLHHLASIGCPVPGSDAQLFLFDRMFTHFEREETIKDLHGKLQDDLIRIHGILDRATPQSIVIMNEIFSSTTLNDAMFLARKVIEQLIALDLLCVCVTFMDELASLGEKTVSMVSTIVPENPAVRTFKVIRRPADGRAYAISIAEKYRLTYECLKTRLPS